MATIEAVPIELLPDEPPTQRLEMVSIELIDFDDVGPDPTADLLKSIKHRGVQSPITLVEIAGGRYFLTAGRRRLKCQIAAGRPTIPALIQSATNVNSSSLTDHALRKANPAAELLSIERLMFDEDYNEKQVSAATGLSIGTIRARLKLRELYPTLRDAFEQGKLTLAAAEAVLKLPDSDQQELAEELEEKGGLTLNDIKDRRRVQRSDTADQLNFGALEAVPPARTNEEIDTRDEQASGTPAASVDAFIGSVRADPDSVGDLAAVALTFLDMQAIAEVREILNRIVTRTR